MRCAQGLGHCQLFRKQPVMALLQVAANKKKKMAQQLKVLEAEVDRLNVLRQVRRALRGYCCAALHLVLVLTTILWLLCCAARPLQGAGPHRQDGAGRENDFQQGREQLHAEGAELLNRQLGGGGCARL